MHANCMLTAVSDVIINITVW